MITELFVSQNGINFVKLDLENDENIPMRYTFKDTQDISKIFTPYSLSFAIKCTPKNLKALGYYGNNDALKFTDLRKLKCKVYVNSFLNQIGLLKLERATYKNGKAEIINASFASNITNLKDRIGEDLINNLGSKIIDWIPSAVRNYTQSVNSSTVDGVLIKWLVPLASLVRVWQYNQTDNAALDNIVYNAASLPTSNKVIKPAELRPAITFSTIVDLIKKKYNLNIVTPLENNTEYKDAFVWCMNELFGNRGIKNRFIIKNNLGALETSVCNNCGSVPLPRKYNSTSSTVNNSILVNRVAASNNYSKNVNLNLTLEGLNFLSNGEKTITISLNRVGQDFDFLSKTFDLIDGNNEMTLEIPDSLFIANQINFQVNLQFDSAVQWSNSKFNVFFNYFDSSFIIPVIAGYQNTSLINNNSLEMGSGKVDLIKSLPPIKVIDFLQSYLKAFNIAILDVNPNDDSLYFYTPQDILANKKTITYTADDTSVEKVTQDDYDYYSFSHVESKFKSNSDYKIAAGQDYGKASFPIVKPPNAKEFKVETKFTIIPPVEVVGINNVTTYYGFTNEKPNILPTNELRYKPNFDELVVFYSHGNTPINGAFGFQSSLFSGALITDSISTYIKLLPYTTDLKSFSWSVLVYQNLSIGNTLFSRYYNDIIKRYISQNVMKHNFSLTLTAKEIKEFRLENDIVIGENKFTVIDSTIDITTGKTKLTLLNY